ncbi:MAG: CBS domain-containing protein [Pseudomonadota bacterium]
MRQGSDQDPVRVPPEYQLSDQDILEAMKGLSGYLDITPGDFREVFVLAYRQAMQRLGLNLRARDLMSTPVVSVGREMPLGQVAQAMARAGVSGVPVLDEGGRVLGVISEKDFLTRLDPQGPGTFMGVVAHCLGNSSCLAAPMLGQSAGQAMSAPAICVGPGASLAEIAALFEQRGVNRAPVVDEHGHLLGIVSRADLVRHAGGRRA